MLSLLKKKKSDAAAPALPAWHPNFRNFERLPDTKVVRTAFFVNGAAIVVTSVLLLWFCYQEYQLRDLRRQVAEWQRQIDRDRPASDKAIALFKKFQADAARVKEIEAFVNSRPLVSELLVQLGQTLPGNIALDTFELRANGLRLVAAVRGAPELASGHASTYLTQLRGNAKLTALFDEITLLNIERNQQTGRLTVEYFLKLKPELVINPGKK
jgi:hypothetical protein